MAPSRSSSMSDTRSQAAGSPSAHSGPNVSSKALCISGTTQVRAWTPFVIEVISSPIPIPANRPRLTSPCSLETPLAWLARRRTSAAMLKWLSSPGSCPNATRSSTGTPHRGPTARDRTRSDRSGSSRSPPAPSMRGEHQAGPNSLDGGWDVPHRRSPGRSTRG